MTPHALISALALPEPALLHQRVSKKDFLEHGKISLSDKKLLNTAVEELWWEASIKPRNVTIPSYNDGEVHCEEIEVFLVVLRDPTKAERVCGMLHRTIPYPLLIVGQSETVFVSMARKRASLADAERVVLIEQFFTQVPADFEGPFLASLALAQLSHFHLHATYEGWVARVIALQAAQQTGIYRIAHSPEDLARQRAEMQRIADVQARIRSLQAEAKRERNLQRLVEINLEVKQLEAEFPPDTSRVNTNEKI
jgi:hypothetical protein